MLDGGRYWTVPELFLEKKQLIPNWGNLAPIKKSNRNDYRHSGRISISALFLKALR